MVLLDTNVVSELVRARPDPAVMAWLDRHPLSSVWISSISVMELHFEHGRARAAIWRALADALARTGAPCEAFVDSLGVAFDAHTVYQPDVLVDCGETIATGSMLAPQPTIIVEVMSPSSRKLDQSLKLTDYFRVESLMHHLIVDLERRFVLHYRRRGEEPITLRIVRDGSIRLDPPGLDLATSDIFA